MTIDQKQLAKAIEYFEHDGHDKETPYAITWDEKMGGVLEAAKAHLAHLETGGWLPIETALKDCCIDTIGTIQTHHGKKVKVRVTDDYMSSNSPYPLTTTYFQHHNGLTGTYTREAWMPLPKLPTNTNPPV